MDEFVNEYRYDVCTVKTYVTHSKWRSSLIQPGWDF